MDALLKLRRLAEHHERVARLELANAERDRVAQEEVVTETATAIRTALGSQSVDPDDHYHRHGYALRMEMARRGAERRLVERQRDVGLKREAMTVAAREKGTLDKLYELREAAQNAELSRVENQHLDEAGLMGWWRRD
ncbi:MAG: hypothetical protein ABMB14_36495 [Myxococcota bacterium]